MVFEIACPACGVKCLYRYSHNRVKHAEATGRDQEFYRGYERHKAHGGFEPPYLGDERFHHDGIFCPECYHSGPGDCHATVKEFHGNH